MVILAGFFFCFVYFKPPFTRFYKIAKVQCRMLSFPGTGFCFQMGRLLPNGLTVMDLTQPEEFLGVCCWPSGFDLSLHNWNILYWQQ